ncbi:MAG: Crp/Fnr family transcriptional regulator [Saprospiraceae bacterium]|nr:Crp/Fnr family transcriptional regulator [Saprospiraceae bacterium]
MECGQNCVSCTKTLSIFDDLRDEEQALISNTKNIVKFKPGEIILKQGTSLTHMACLSSGLAKIYLEGVNNKNLIIKFLRPTQIVGGPGLFTDYKLHFSVKAIEECYACLIDVNIIKQISDKNHEFALKLLCFAHEQAIRSYKKFINLTQKQMHGRIADAILHFSKNIFPYNTNGFNISRQDLADFTGMAKESAIRIIKEFKDEGLIEINNKNILIKNKNLLQTISEKS